MARILELPPPLTIWTIYDHPRDYPHGYVIRPWTIGNKGPMVPGEAATAADLDTARTLIPDGLYRMERAPDDDPAIIETWM
jgi:hypothetical protein